MALYLVATPIGNLADMTFRAIEVLRTVEVVILESYSNSIKLLKHFEIRPKKILVFNDRNRKKMLPVVLEVLKKSDAAYIVSAGTPGISDPGQILVQQCYKNQIKVVPVPAASALSAAISTSGFASQSFLFVGFLPKKRGQILKVFKEASENDHRLVFFESPYRLQKTLNLLATAYPLAEIFIGKEMTKMFETYWCGSIGEICEKTRQNRKFFKGEFTAVVWLKK